MTTSRVPTQRRVARSGVRLAGGLVVASLVVACGGGSPKSAVATKAATVDPAAWLGGKPDLSAVLDVKTLSSHPELRETIACGREAVVDDELPCRDEILSTRQVELWARFADEAQGGTREAVVVVHGAPSDARCLEGLPAKSLSSSVDEHGIAGEGAHALFVVRDGGEVTWVLTSSASAARVRSELSTSNAVPRAELPPDMVAVITLHREGVGFLVRSNPMAAAIPALQRIDHAEMTMGVPAAGSAPFALRVGFGAKEDADGAEAFVAPLLAQQKSLLGQGASEIELKRKENDLWLETSQRLDTIKHQACTKAEAGTAKSPPTPPPPDLAEAPAAANEPPPPVAKKKPPQRRKGGKKAPKKKR